MRGGLVVVGTLLVLAGIVWILQGTNILPGSFMTGDPFWAMMGLLSAGLGSYLLYRGLARRGKR